MREALKLALDWLESGTFVYPTTLSIAIKEALAQPTSGDYALGYAEGFNDACKKPEQNNFCPRCGKRTPDPAAIHTCTPPRGLEMT